MLQRRLYARIKNAVRAMDEVVAGDVGGKIGRNANADKLVTVGEAVVFGAYAGAASPGKVKHQRLAGAAA